MLKKLLQFKNFQWNIFFKELIWFVGAFALAIWLGMRLLRIFEVTEVEKPEISLGRFLIYFLALTALMLLFLKTTRRGAPFKVFFILTIFIGIQIFFGAIFTGLLPTVLALAFVLIRILNPTVWIHNLVVMLALVGASAVLGLSISPTIAVALLAILSVYDIIAVYKTKHMVKMAKEMAKRGALFAFIVPEKIQDMRAHIKHAQPGDRKFLIMGGGDVALPLLLIVSVIPQGIKFPIVVAAFTLLGFLFTHILFSSQKIRRPMPALPPIALAAILGYLVILI